jgi:predicted GNAT superfamily acetyltransferase
MTTTVTIRPIEGDTEYEAIEIVQESTWGMSAREIIPGRLMHALQHNGAALLGAYDGKRLVGFVLGVISTVEGMNERVDQIAAARLQMYSAIMGVLPEYQQQGVGLQLKLAQRDFALRVGIRLVTWTYDPLQSRNAWFNFGKLGVIANRYLRDFHGKMGGINAGLPTDRLEVQWWVTSNRVQSRTANKRRPLSLDALVGGGAIIANESRFNASGLVIPPDNFQQNGQTMVLAEIPVNFPAIKQQDMALAEQWREHSRQLFEYYLQRNYIVTDFARHTAADGRERCFYLLTQRTIEANDYEN